MTPILSSWARATKSFWRDLQLMNLSDKLIELSNGDIPAKKRPGLVAAWNAAQVAVAELRPDWAMRSVLRLALDQRLSDEIRQDVVCRYKTMLRVEAVRDLASAVKIPRVRPLVFDRASVLCEFLDDIYKMDFLHGLRITTDLLGADGADKTQVKAAKDSYKTAVQASARVDVNKAIHLPKQSALYTDRAIALYEFLPEIRRADFYESLDIACELLEAPELSDAQKKHLTTTTLDSLPVDFSFRRDDCFVREADGALLTLSFLNLVFIHVPLDEDLENRIEPIWERSFSSTATSLETKIMGASLLSDFAEQLGAQESRPRIEKLISATWHRSVGEDIARADRTMAMGLALREVRPARAHRPILVAAAQQILEELGPGLFSGVGPSDQPVP